MGIAIILPSMIVALAVSTAFMIALRPIAESTGLVDRPGGRKSHVGDVPIIGGMAMFAGIFSGFAVLVEVTPAISSLVAASLLLVVIGVTDDKHNLPATVRLVAQIAAVLIMVFGANTYLWNIGDPFGTGIITLGPAALIVTMVVTLTMINAYNLIDGADGLAGTLVLVALVSFAIVGGWASPSTAIAMTVAASVVGYLLFNFPVSWNRPLRSFMGDAGSTMLGLMIAWIGIAISQGPGAQISPVHCLWFASIPIYDCLTCFVRRILAKKSPLTPGRDHFHHTLKRGGLGFRKTIVILTGLQVLYAAIGLIGYFADVADVAMFAAWSVLGLSQRFVIKLIARYHRHRQIHVRKAGVI